MRLNGQVGLGVGLGVEVGASVGDGVGAGVGTGVGAGVVNSAHCKLVIPAIMIVRGHLAKFAIPKVKSDLPSKINPDEMVFWTSSRILLSGLFSAPEIIVSSNAIPDPKAWASTPLPAS
jgi:hypothetical protein